MSEYLERMTFPTSYLGGFGGRGLHLPTRSAGSTLYLTVVAFCTKAESLLLPERIILSENNVLSHIGFLRVDTTVS